MDRFWLFDWLDEFGITTKRQVEAALRDRVLVADLLLRAKKVHSEPITKRFSSGSILVGRGLDFSRVPLQCPKINCRKHQVNELFSLVWHYFDRIIVADGYTALLAHWPEDRLNETLRADLKDFLELLVYLRQIGADRIIGFEAKPSAASADYERLVKLAHLEGLLQSRERLVETIKADYFPRFRKFRSYTEVWFNYGGPGEHGFDLPKNLSKKAAIEMAAEHCFESHMAFLATDLTAARRLGLPLGVAVPPQNLLLSQLTTVNETEVALSVELPVLKNLSTVDLIHIKEENLDAFQRFRKALKSTIEEKVKNARSSNSSDVARQIEEEFLKPGIEEITRRLKVAEIAVNKKSFIAVGLGSLTTFCGLVAGVAPPAALAAGVATTTALAGKASMEFVDASSETEFHDLFFLWKALRHTRH